MSPSKWNTHAEGLSTEAESIGAQDRGALTERHGDSGRKDVANNFQGGNHQHYAVDKSRNDNSRHHYGNNLNYSNTTTNYAITSTRSPLDRLEDRISKGAAHDSEERGTDAPQCAAETRVAVQDEILSWIEHGVQDDNSTSILWLSGPAGSGKTAIAGSIANTCHSRGWLAASFFFSASVPSPDRCSKRHFITTLAYHLLESIPELRGEILSSIEAHPSVFEKRLIQQLEILILKPLRRLNAAGNPRSWPKVLVIDGIDECSADQGKTDQERQRSRESNLEEIIAVLAHASADPSFPFRTIVASRPERAIRRTFTALQTLPTPQPIKEIFLDDKYSPHADIELFVRATLITIGREFGLGNDWFSPDVPRSIAEEASGQFIYAATALRFVRDGFRPPREQLKRILDWRRFDSAPSQPFASLDALYRGILETSPDPSMAVKWLCAIQRWSFWDHWTASDSRALLETSPGETEFLLGGLSSIVGLIGSDGKPAFKFYHKSFIDFLLHKGRSASLYMSNGIRNQFINDRFYQVLHNRGSQGGIGSEIQFINSFCFRLDLNMDHRRKYEADDVNWWLEQSFIGKEQTIQNMFFKVHNVCHWFHCLPACKVWRKGILRYCEAEGWRLPTWTELLRNRHNMLYDPSRKYDQQYMLRPNSSSSSSSGIPESRE